MPRNRNAEMVLRDELGYMEQSCENIVKTLIEGGFIEAEPLSEPERIAEAARNWLGNGSSKSAKQVFDYASGWTTSSWEYVLGEKFEDSNPMMSKEIFAALVLLAKEAGIDL